MLKIQNNNKNDVGYITALLPAFLPGGDMFRIFIVIVVIFILFRVVSAVYRKNKSSQMANRRISSLRREFNNVKEESLSKSEDNWIEDRLNADDPDLDDFTFTNEK